MIRRLLALTVLAWAGSVLASRLIARMPVFRTRKVETTVTIEDGSTIAMGGLIKEATETFKDSVPILGKTESRTRSDRHTVFF